MTKGKMVAAVTGFLARIGQAVWGRVTKDRLDRGKRYLNVWTRRYPVEFFAGVAGVALVLWVLSPVYMRLFFGDDAGTKGDSFGALTSFFTGAAFVGLIATLMQQQREIRMQRQDLKLQRDEMKETRGVLAGQNEQMELQNQSLKQQMFEQTFFNLLNVFNQYIADISGPYRKDSGQPRTGRDQLEAILRGATSTGAGTSTAIARTFVSSAPKEANDLNSYFRLVYNILKLVDRSEIEDKKVYTNILRAQLSDSELQLIALNCARKEGAKLQVLVERYRLLQHLPPELKGQEINEIRDEIRRLETEGSLTN